MLRRRGFALPALAVVAAPAAAVTLAATALLMSGHCSAGGAVATPTAAASKAIPPPLLAIYEQVGAQYGLPWQLLAGIGQEECDQGRNPDPSCAIVAGETGPGVANYAGASGPMQIGVGGAAGDEYDTYRRYLQDPSLGPHDPATAVQLAALVLIKSKGAVPGRPLADYLAAVTAYNGAGPAAAAYAARVLRDAVSYGAGGAVAGGACGPAPTLLVPGSVAKILPDGDAAAPQSAPAAVQAMIAAGNRIDHFDYQWGGGHASPELSDSQTNPQPQGGARPGDSGTPGYDCSGATDYVLYGGGLSDLLGGGDPASPALEGVGLPGPGRWVTIYANAGHAYIQVAGIYLDTAAGKGRPPNPPSTGPRWSPTGTGPGGFVASHPPGL